VKRYFSPCPSIVAQTRSRPFLALLLLSGFTSLAAAQNPPASGFRLQEATIADIHAAFSVGTLTCHQLVGLYLDRIGAYEDGGPRLNAITTVNSKATEAAAALDAQRQSSGRMSSLHCIPILLKDNINTADMPTSAGSAILRNSVPHDDAPIVTALKNAGALILGKAAMGELAASSYNTIDGQQVNPYNFKRGTGGSSSGSAAAVAANLTALAVGTDTLTSVRGPAAFNGIVGLRPTTGLISRNGIAPRKLNVDTAGPMARTVTDAAKLLNVLAAPDPADPLSVEVFSKYPAAGKAGGRYADFTQHLKKGSLKGARIGVVQDFFGGDPEIDALARASVAKMESLGAQIVEVRLDPDFLDRYVQNGISNLTNILMYRFREGWESYLATLGPEVPKTVAEWVKIYETELSKAALPPELGGARVVTTLKNSLAHEANEPAYQDMINNILPNLTLLKLAIYEQHKVDALVLPYQPTFAPPISNPVQRVDDPTFVAAPGRPNPANLGGYSSVGFPMIIVPMGFGTQGLPMGIAIMGRPYDEGRIIGYAFDYEQATTMRHPPPLLPPLPGEGG
jgi:amidase